jgi:uncharacterized protein (DUF1501 family)
MSCTEHVALSRRRLLGGGAATLALWGLTPRIAAASNRDPRLLTVVLRGGLDGLSMVAPVGDPLYAGLRGVLAIPREGEGAGLPLDAMFALNGAMPFLHGLYQRKQVLFLHAVATPYRGRSHFDGQDMLESGLPSQGRVDDGWLNRALAVLPSSGRAAPQKGLSIGAMVPLIMRGPAPVVSMSTQAYNTPLRDATAARLLDLYRHADPKLAEVLAAGFDIDRMGGGAALQAAKQGQQGPRAFANFIETAGAAARFLTAADGPRIGALAYDGWDTHANEGAVKGLLANRLAGLDAALKALHDGLGEAAWAETCVLVVTEFGRTARINGSDGTDHGTATVAVLIGGAVKGGRVVADWPGLAEAALYEGRDLRPTSDLRALIKGVLRDHLGLPAGLLSGQVFPDSRSVAAMTGVVA